MWLSPTRQPQEVWYASTNGLPIPMEADPQKKKSRPKLTPNPRLECLDEYGDPVPREVDSDGESIPILRRSLAGPSNPDWHLLFPHAPSRKPADYREDRIVYLCIEGEEECPRRQSYRQ